MPVSPAAALLARERQSRRDGSGIQIEQLPGCWMLQQTWNRGGDAPTPGTALLLRWLQASLILSRGDQGLSIVNQVCLAGFRLRFSGHAQLKGSRPLLMFSFTSLELTWSHQVLLQRPLPSRKPQRLSFFALIELNDQQGTLTARGRGGGLAQWSRHKPEAP
ncbi:hypothetical protein [Parasynechococcus sp.]|uniref:hypothetical protein n=1 Tax=Parasynechococcus sp. TaxID=3101203 RepID=UPI003703B3A0